MNGVAVKRARVEVAAAVPIAMTADEEAAVSTYARLGHRLLLLTKPSEVERVARAAAAAAIAEDRGKLLVWMKAQKQSYLVLPPASALCALATGTDYAADVKAALKSAPRPSLLRVINNSSERTITRDVLTAAVAALDTNIAAAYDRASETRGDRSAVGVVVAAIVDAVTSQIKETREQVRITSVREQKTTTADDRYAPLVIAALALAMQHKMEVQAEAQAQCREAKRALVATMEATKGAARDAMRRHALKTLCCPLADDDDVRLHDFISRSTKPLTKTETRAIVRAVAAPLMAFAAPPTPAALTAWAVSTRQALTDGILAAVDRRPKVEKQVLTVQWAPREREGSDEESEEDEASE